MVKSFLNLIKYCETEVYKGWDPYDGLNSSVFQSTPLKHIRLARLAWIQAFKKSPVNFRRLFIVKKDYNSKGLALFLFGYCRMIKVRQGLLGIDEEYILNKIIYLANSIIKLRSSDYNNFCWGYNFDWQNRVFFQPRNTPTVVVTSFVANSLFEAYEITKNKKYLNAGLSACNFITQDLNRTKISDYEFIFSYSPVDQSQVYNASLLGARLLARGYYYTKNEAWRRLSLNAVKTIINKQQNDGSWKYGEDPVQNWIDSFHTGFNLECINDYMVYTRDFQFMNELENGLFFYRNNFFLKNGTPKYFASKVYPIDIHSPAQFIVTYAKTGLLVKYIDLVETVLNWTIKNMQDRRGYFYYQLKKGISSKIPYMRWGQAWMFYAFSNYYYALYNENMD